MMPSYEFENGQLREENNALRHSRNAAQQRAEQAERERDEAIDLLMRIRAITTASLAPAPTVKADDAPKTVGPNDDLIAEYRARTVSGQATDDKLWSASDALNEGKYLDAIRHLIHAVAYLNGALRIHKGGAS